MRGIIRTGIDFSTGHCFFPRPCITGSKNVMVNFIGACRVGDYYPYHKCGLSGHDGFALSKSNVFVNNRPVHRKADPVSCGDFAGLGSPNVFAN
jgi:uncharacterized Zn-binding protein involved in type VI secretion